MRQGGEAGYEDLWSKPGLSYGEQVDRMLEKLEANHTAYDGRDYDRFHRVISDFAAALSTGGGA